MFKKTFRRIQELQEKLQQKMEEATKRHQEKLNNIRQKAFELSVQRCSTDEAGVPPMLQAYDPKKKCNICQVLILNEVQLQSHLRYIRSLYSSFKVLWIDILLIVHQGQKALGKSERCQ